MKQKKIEVVTGLDIGSYSIKCVQVAQLETGQELQRAQIIPITAEKDVSKGVRELELTGLHHIRVSVSGSSVLTRRITMPLLNAKELQSAIRFEAEGHIPFPIDDCLLDYQVLTQNVEKREMNLLLAAVKKDFVEARYKFLTDAGIRPELLDLDMFSMINAFEGLYPAGTDKQYGLLHVGHQNSLFAIVREGLTVFVREILHGGVGVTQALMEIKTLTAPQADTLKIAKPAEEAENLTAALQKGYEPLTEEIRQSIDYVENEIKEEVKQVYVSGGGALAFDALPMLTREIGKPVSFWKKAEALKLGPGVDAKFFEEHLAELAIALGLVVRGLGATRK